MAGIDITVLILYFVGILAFGSLFGKNIRTTKDFFFGGQRFSWWIIAFSCVATVVGSYSFVKYSNRAYHFGFSSTMTYLNDWLWIPLWMGVWLPIVYYSRVESVPEYFERRFDKRVGMAVTVLLMVYLLGYVGINFFTLGVALHALVPWGIFEWAVVVAVISGAYVTFGGQTSVIMTDLLQGFLLLVAGFFLLIVGVLYLKTGHVIIDQNGLSIAETGGFWANFPGSYRQAFTSFTEPANFSAVGIFWQDGIANTAAFYFINQGLIMRFLAVRSEADGRKAMFVLVLVLMPLAAVAVSGAGWIGRAMEFAGLLTPTEGDKIFVVVSRILCSKGVFGLIIAALIAALMSTADTLINAAAAIWVNDIWRPYIKPNREDKHYLKIARWVSAIAAVVGILLVPIYMQFESIFDAHGTFTASITPPLVVALLMGVLWKRYTSAGALATLVVGTGLILLSMLIPEMIVPFAHGSEPGGEGAKAFKYLRACFGVAACVGVGFLVSWLAPPLLGFLKKTEWISEVGRAYRPKPEEELRGLVAGSRKEALESFKGGPENKRKGETLHCKVTLSEALVGDVAGLHPEDLKRLAADAGDILYVSDARWWLGGLRSTHVKAVPDDGAQGGVRLNAAVVETAMLVKLERPITVVKII